MHGHARNLHGFHTLYRFFCRGVAEKGKDELKKKAVLFSTRVKFEGFVMAVGYFQRATSVDLKLVYVVLEG